MAEPLDQDVLPVGRDGAGIEKKSVRKGRKSARQVETHSRPGGVQVTVNCPRDVVELYDQVAADAGVMRSHLMREALELYAAVLQSGHRTYRQPGLRRAG